MKILNIDTFAQVKRQISSKGKNHDVVETSVQKFIDSLKAAEELEAAGKSGQPEKLSAQVEASVNVILESIPTFPREELVNKPIETLGAILKFIRGEYDPEGGDAPAAPAAEEGGEGKKPA